MPLISFSETCSVTRFDPADPSSTLLHLPYTSLLKMVKMFDLSTNDDTIEFIILYILAID